MLQPSVQTKLDSLCERYAEIAELLATPLVLGDRDRLRDLGREYSALTDIVGCYQRYLAVCYEIANSRLIAKDPDPLLQEMALEELRGALQTQEDLQKELEIALLPTDANDGCNIFLEIRAGTGGDEAAIFCGDLAKMYQKFAEKKGWNTEIINSHHGEHGGYKGLVVLLKGAGVWTWMQFEGGTHRVQRVPDTESQGRIHTSACTVAIMPEVTAVNIDINPADLRVDTFKASGSGGQHVNKTDSAIRLTHLPSGLVVECQDERSQHKNRARAMSLLQSRLLAAQTEELRASTAADRLSQVGSGDRSEKIRTYNYPQGRVTDHRINLSLYKLDDIMQGELEGIVEPLLHKRQAQLLGELGFENG